MWREKDAINPLVYNDLEFTDRGICDRSVSEELPPVDSAQIPPPAKIQKISSYHTYETSLFSCKLLPFDQDSHSPPSLKRQSVEPTSSHRSQTSFVYKTRASRRGTCLIISVDTFKPALCLPSRPGADVDLTKLVDTFHFLEFDVKTYQNPTVANILSIIEAESSASHADADCFACVILTHGDDGGSIYATDGPIHLDQFIHPFRGDTCPSLAGKPKLFFIQACRGTLLDAGTIVSTDSAFGACESGTFGSLRRIPIEADLLIAYAVQPGYYAFRNSVNGSWFIQALINGLRKYGRILDLMSILTRVNYEVAFEFESLATTAEYSGKKQVPSVVSTLTKDVFFPPKTPPSVPAPSTSFSCPPTP